MVRFFIGLVFTVIVLLFTFLASGLGSNLAMVIDLPSALVVIIFPLIFLIILHGCKNFRSAFFIICNKNIIKKDLLNAKAFFEDYGKTIFSIAFFAFVISFMAIMMNLEVKEALGLNMVIASIQLLYTGIINMVIIIPYKVFINRKIVEIESGK